MAFETREEVLEKVLSMKRPACPHCGAEMQIWEVPPINFSDGLGWGAPYLFLCVNDKCPVFVNGWEELEENYAQHASMRCYNYPGTKDYGFMPVFSSMGGKGQLIDDQELAAQEALKENIKKGFSILAQCWVSKDGVTVMSLLMDATEPMRVRVKAAEMIGDMGELEAIEPLRSMKVGNQLLQKNIDDAISKIHDRNFTRECPFCAEIIKKRAKVCKHCNREVAGV